MEYIIVVAYLVTCSANLLECHELDTDRRQWKAHGDCVAELPRLRRHYLAAGYNNVMGECRYMIDKDGRRHVPLG